MQYPGLACNEDLLRAGADACTEWMDALAGQIRHILDSPSLNVGSPKELQKLLDLSTTAEAVLREHPHPAAPLILEWRAYQKLRGTYFAPFLDFSSCASDGRLHPCLHQAGTRTGRFSCSDPNLQGAPRSRDQAQGVPLVRSCIMADPGHVFLFADYSQAELRLIVRYAEKGLLYEAMKQGDDIHAQTARILFGEDATDAQRQIGKTMNFAMLYGAGRKEISAQLGVSEDEAAPLMGKFRSAYPELYKLSVKAQAKAYKRGFTRLWTGRRAHYPDTARQFTRNALAHLIQGGVAEMVKRAMLRIDEALRERGWGEVIFQMHDEVICSVPEQHADEAAVLMKRLGEDFPLEPPPILEVSVGTTWANTTRIA